MKNDAPKTPYLNKEILTDAYAKKENQEDPTLQTGESKQ